MPRLSQPTTRGALRSGWHARVDDYATAIAWGPSGNLIYAADAAGGLHAFDGRSGARRWRVQAHDGSVMAISRHPIEPLLASAGQDRRVALWNAETGELVRSLEVPERWVEHVSWSPAGRWLAAASGRMVRTWTAAGQPVCASEQHPSTVSAIAWAAPGEILSACYGGVRFWSIPDGGLREALEWKGSLISVALSPDGGIVVCGSQDNTIHFWRRASGKDSEMSGYPNKPTALTFDAAGRLLATGGSEHVTVWCFGGGGPEGTEPSMLSVHTGTITALRFAHRGRILASGCRDGGVILWQLDQRGRGSAIGGAVVDGVVEAVAWRDDDQALAAIDGRGGVTTMRVRT